MEAVQRRRSRSVTAIVLALVVFPLCAVPIYAIGHAADDFDSSGGLSGGLLLGQLLPAIAAGCMARYWAAWNRAPAVLLGLGSYFASGAVTLVAFVVLFGSV
jgi:hypothetical protein